MDDAKKEAFLGDLRNFILKSKHYESVIPASINCSNMFDDVKLYEFEKELLVSISASCAKSTTEQGDALESLMKALFGRVKIIDSIEITNRDTAVGQIDLQLTPLGSVVYDVLGLTPDIPLGLMGECKNYGKARKIEREEVEKTCWRSCKTGFLSFFIGPRFTAGALNEIDEFNLYKDCICCRHCGVFIVPISLEMISLVIQHEINFCYFIKWAISRSITHKITTYLRGA